LIEYINVIQIR